ncbi:MAG: hypothetical protein JWM68_1189 [Verrucomicrobiales bacterium]|nr:hypothetical protein [Verrucomicrobiales bacterium]
MKLALLCLLVLALERPIQAQGVKDHSFAIVFRGDSKTSNSTSVAIADADILEFRFAEQKVKLRPDAFARLLKMPLSLSGKPFEILVDGQQVYAGLFVPAVSSMTYKEPTILIGMPSEGETNTIAIRRPFAPEAIFSGKADPRFDERIKEALKRTGKFVEGDRSQADHDPALTAAVARVLNEWKNLSPGKTREDLLKVFTTEGGLSTSTQRTFVHRECPYIKVEVEFTLSDPQQNGLEERATDKIKSISRPYLFWSIID